MWRCGAERDGLAPVLVESENGWAGGYSPNENNSVVLSSGSYKEALLVRAFQIPFLVSMPLVFALLSCARNPLEGSLVL